MESQEFQLGLITSGLAEATKAIDSLRQMQLQNIQAIATLAQQVLYFKESVEKQMTSLESYRAELVKNKEELKGDMDRRFEEFEKRIQSMIGARSGLSGREKIYVLGTLITGVCSLLATIFANWDKIFR